MTHVRPSCRRSRAGSHLLTVAVYVAISLSAACAEKITDTSPLEEINGTIEAQLLMTGDFMSPDGCKISLDRGPERKIRVGQKLAFTSVTPGLHTLTLKNIETGCEVAGSNPREVPVMQGQKVETKFRVHCHF